MAPGTSKTATPKAKATDKATDAGVKKAGRPAGGKGRKGKASAAMAKMQAYCELTRFIFPKSRVTARQAYDVCCCHPAQPTPPV